jgi:hypothetical protein
LRPYRRSPGHDPVADSQVEHLAAGNVAPSGSNDGPAGGSVSFGTDHCAIGRSAVADDKSPAPRRPPRGRRGPGLSEGRLCGANRGVAYRARPTEDIEVSPIAGMTREEGARCAAQLI